MRLEITFISADIQGLSLPVEKLGDEIDRHKGSSENSREKGAFAGEDGMKPIFAD